MANTKNKKRRDKKRRDNTNLNKRSSIDFMGTLSSRGSVNNMGMTGSVKPFVGTLIPVINNRQINKTIYGNKPSGFMHGLYNPISKKEAVPYYLKPNIVNSPFKTGNIQSPFKFQTKGIPTKDIRWTQAQGNKKYRKINLNPFGDHDKDGILNMYDCRPFDPKRQEDLKKGKLAKAFAAEKEAAKKKGKKKKSKIKVSIYGPGDVRETAFGKDRNKTMLERARSEAIGAEVRAARDFIVQTDDATSRFADRQIKRARETVSDADWQTRIHLDKLKARTKNEAKEAAAALRDERIAINKARIDAQKEKTKDESGKWRSKKDIAKTKLENEYRKDAKAREKREYKIRKLGVELDSKRQRADLGSIESLGRTRDILASRRLDKTIKATSDSTKLKESKKYHELEDEYNAETNARKKNNLKKKMDQLSHLSIAEEKRLSTNIDYILMMAKKDQKGRAITGDVEEMKQRAAIILEESGLGGIPKGYKTAKKFIATGLKRDSKKKRGLAKAYASRTMKGLQGMGLIGGGSLQSHMDKTEALNMRDIQRAEIAQVNYEKAMAKEAKNPKGAGRPFGTYKYGMPIDEYTAMMNQKESAIRIQKAMAEAQQVEALQAKTNEMLSSGITYGPVGSTQGQVSMPTSISSSPYDALPAVQAPVGMSQPRLSDASYTTLMNKQMRDQGWDMPMKRYNRRMTTSELRSIPNIYGNMDADPRRARMPSLPTDPILIREDSSPHTYIADASSNGMGGPDGSLAGSVPMQYAQKVKDVRAPVTKNMILQTQNDGQRKMVPIIKANPWGLQLKNRINFSENNILEADLQGNVASRDQIGGNVLNAPNVFAGDTRTNYGQQKQVSGPMAASGWASGRMTDENINNRYGQQPPANVSWLSRKQEQRPEVTGLGNQYTSSINQLSQQERLVMMQEKLAEQRARQQQLMNPQKSPPTPFGKFKNAVSAITDSPQDQLGGIQEPEISVNMTQEEFNALSTEEQQQVIEQSQINQQTQAGQSRANDEMAAYEAQMNAEMVRDRNLYRDALMVRNNIELGKAARWQEAHADTNVGSPMPLSDYNSIKAQTDGGPSYAQN